MSPEICRHFGVCGGCTQQDVLYQQQLKKKEQHVYSCLEGIPIQNFHSIRPSPATTFYRNKMEYSFGDLRDVEILKSPKGKRKKGEPLQFNFNQLENKVHVGLHPRKRFNLVTPTPHCQLQSEESQKICNIVSMWATEFQIPTFTRHNHQGKLRHLVIREGKNTGERMVNLFSKSDLAKTEVLHSRLQESTIPISTFLWTIHDGVSDVAKGESAHVLWGEGIIHEKVNDVVFRVPPQSFMQTNTHAAEQMIKILKEWVQEDLKTSSSWIETFQDDAERILFDLYCGSGVIGLNLAPHVSKVIGIEMDERAIEEAQQNAKLNNITNTEFLAGRVENLIPEIRSRCQGNSHMVLDPPRSGLHPRVIETLLELDLPSLIYVSCQPVNLARDLRALTAKYRITDVQPMDFFPHTDHVETLVWLRRT